MGITHIYSGVICKNTIENPAVWPYIANLDANAALGELTKDTSLCSGGFLWFAGIGRHDAAGNIQNDGWILLSDATLNTGFKGGLISEFGSGGFNQTNSSAVFQFNDRKPTDSSQVGPSFFKWKPKTFENYGIFQICAENRASTLELSPSEKGVNKGVLTFEQGNGPYGANENKQKRLSGNFLNDGTVKLLNTYVSVDTPALEGTSGCWILEGDSSLIFSANGLIEHRPDQEMIWTGQSIYFKGDKSSLDIAPDLMDVIMKYIFRPDILQTLNNYSIGAILYGLSEGNTIKFPFGIKILGLDTQTFETYDTLTVLVEADGFASLPFPLKVQKGLKEELFQVVNDKSLVYKGPKAPLPADVPVRCLVDVPTCIPLPTPATTLSFQWPTATTSSVAPAVTTSSKVPSVTTLVSSTKVVPLPTST